MTINTKDIINDFNNGMNLKLLSKKYKMTEKQLQEAIQKELHLPGEEQYREYERQVTEHNKKINNEYSLAYDKLQSGNYFEALKLGLSATITMLFNAPKNPYIITGEPPIPLKWADVKSIIGLIKSLKNLPQIISKLKNCKSINQFKNFMTEIVKKLKPNKSKSVKKKTKVGAKTTAETHGQLIQKYSKGKKLIDMTDEELVLYYKKLIPGINKEELKCLIDQVHRIKKGEPRWLNTEEEQDLLRSINDKLIKHQRNKGISRQKYDTCEHKPADIPFEKRELTDFQRSQLSRWYNKEEGMEYIFDELATVLDHDVCVYRCVTVRAEGSASAQHNQCNFLNSLKEGGMIDNGNNFTSTAKNINNVLNNGRTFEQSYVLKIKIPKGTKVLDMRHLSSNIPGKKEIDEIVLPPSSYKVNKINYTTGVIDCDFIPH